MTDPMVDTLSLDELDSYPFQYLSPDKRHRVDVVTEHAVLPFLVVRKLDADSVVVMNNGAVDHAKARRKVVFHRSSWSTDIRHHQIYFYDPATGAPDYLSLAWGQLAAKTSVVYVAVRAIRTIARALGATAPGQRLYFGSSAGGYMALSMLANDRGAAALINNAQFDWTRWMPTGVNPLRSLRYENRLPTVIRERYPLNTNVLNVLAKRQAPLSIRYFVNLASDHDYKIDYPMFQRFLLEHPGLCRDVQVSHYFDPRAGHNPLDRSQLVPILNS